MKEFKGTKGLWTFSPQIKTTIIDNEIRGCHQAQVWDNSGKSLVVIEPTKDESIASNNAQLIAAAPELLVALQGLLRVTKQTVHPEIDYARGSARSAINKALNQ